MFADAMPGAQTLIAPDPRLVRRLCGFAVISVALHALTLVAYTPGPSGGLSASGAPRLLHATLAAAPAVAVSPEVVPEHVSGHDARAADTTPTAEASTRPAENIQPQSGADARAVGSGFDIPLPDKWYAASELEQRAEPITVPRLRYPDELAGSGIAGKVRVRLFVDERGTVRKIEIAEAGSDGAFDAAAIQAWESVRFSPAIKAGIAVKSQKLLELDFAPF